MKSYAMKEFPSEFTLRMKELLGDGYGDFEQALNEPEVKAFRVNTDKVSRGDTDWISVFGTERVPYVRCGYYLEADGVGNHPFHHAGMIYVQDPGAMTPVECVDILPEWRVLDLCAAPGGKSSQIRNALGEGGALVSNETVPSRCRILTGNIERLGAHNTVTTCLDSARIARQFPEYFDLVVVDAPCSGEGMFRKGDIAVQEWSPENVERCAVRQSEILDRAALTVKRGGYLLYSTCTYSLQENEMNVDRFLRTHPEYELVPVSERVRSCTSPGVDFEGCTCRNISYTRRFYPHVGRGEGQFMALMRNTELPVCVDERVPDAKRVSAPGRETLAFLSDLLVDFTPDEVRVYNGKPVIFTGGISLVDGVAFSFGVTVGEVRKGYIQPHHQLFAAMGDRFKRKIELSPESEQMARFLRGEEFETDGDNGWSVVTTHGCAVGGVKVVGGVAKNHYPKGLRRLF